MKNCALCRAEIKLDVEYEKELEMRGEEAAPAEAAAAPEEAAEAAEVAPPAEWKFCLFGDLTNKYLFKFFRKNDTII